MVEVVASPADSDLAGRLSVELQRRFGAALPVVGSGNDERMGGLSNRLWVGPSAIPKRLRPREADAVEAGEVAVVATRGRALLDGADAAWRETAVELFLASQGSSIARDASLPGGVNGLMTEAYVLRRAYFRDGIPDCGGVAEADESDRPSDLPGALAALRAAARNGLRSVPAEAASAARLSAANCLAIRRVALDPFSN
jgi:hypothetical protein